MFVILSESLNKELQKYSTLDLLKMLKEYEQYKDSGSMDDGGIRGEIEYFIRQNNDSYPFGVASCIVALEVSVVLLTRLNHIE